jgi:Glycosyl transferase family 21
LRAENTLVIRSQSTIPAARQLGAEAARTEWLLFTDADVIFPADYFERLRDHLEHDCVYGSKLSLDRFRRYYRLFSYGQQLCQHAGIPAASGSNLAIRKRVLAAVGGFDPMLSCNEDSEVVWRIRRAGFQVRFGSDIPVYATDHRRLERGLGRKTAHSIARCLTLYSGLAPYRWRHSDWGYWAHVRQEDD